MYLRFFPVRFFQVRLFPVRFFPVRFFPKTTENDVDRQRYGRSPILKGHMREFRELYLSITLDRPVNQLYSPTQIKQCETKTTCSWNDNSCLQDKMQWMQRSLYRGNEIKKQVMDCKKEHQNDIRIGEQNSMIFQHVADYNHNIFTSLILQF